jgi:diguanylate cyclase (GGDEF)-like protein
MPSALRFILALGAVALVAGLDATAGPRLVFAPFSFVIVALAGWQLGRVQGVAVGAAAGFARLASELAWVDASVPVLWSGLAWTALFIALAWCVRWARDRHARVASLEERVTELIQIEHRFARTDTLTSLCNRRAFIDALRQAEARSRRSGGALAVVRLDVDGFCRLNETYSRADGDQVLRAVAAALALTTRMGDLAARLENDEFAILLYSCGPSDAQRVGQRLVAEVADIGRAYPEARATASVGIACFASAGPDPDEMMRLAGSALRRVQEDGGNGVLVEREWAAGHTNAT